MAHLWNTGKCSGAQNLKLAIESALVDAGHRAQTLRDTMQVELKPDGSLVTNVDRDVEDLLRVRLNEIAPGAGFWGEESGFEPDNSHGLWLVDPIDGTSNFVFGLPLWGVTLAYYQNGAIRAGGVIMPDMGWVFVAERGRGTTLNGEALPKLKPGPIAAHELIGSADEEEGPFADIPGKRRHLGAFIAEAMFMARGGLRAMVATKAKLYDAAGSMIVLRELGADIWNGDWTPFDESQWVIDSKMDPHIIAAPGIRNRF